MNIMDLQCSLNLNEFGTTSVNGLVVIKACEIPRCLMVKPTTFALVVWLRDVTGRGCKASPLLSNPTVISVVGGPAPTTEGKKQLPIRSKLTALGSQLLKLGPSHSLSVAGLEGTGRCLRVTPDWNPRILGEPELLACSPPVV